MTATLAPPPAPAAPATPPATDEKDNSSIGAILARSTPEERAADPSKGQECAAALYELANRWSQAHEHFYREADQSWRFYNGEQWSYWSAALGTIVTRPDASQGVTRLTFNKIKRGVERCVSILIADRPIIKCLAGQTEVVDQAASEAADNVAEWRQRNTTLAAEPERIARASLIAGIAWVHSEFDTSAGPLVELKNPDGSPQIQNGADGLPVKVKGPRGAFVREILLHRQGIPDPAAQTPFLGSAFFVRKSMSRFFLKQKFPTIDLGAFPAESDDKMGKTWDVGRSVPSRPGQPATGGAEARDSIEVLIGYVPKCDGYPQGRRFVFTQQALLEETDNKRYPTEEEIAKGESEPNPHEEPPWPCFPYIHTHRESSPFGNSPVPSAIQPQKFLNGLASTSAMHVDRVGRAKVKVPTDMKGQWSNETGQELVVPRRGFDNNTLGYIAAPPLSPENLNLWHQAAQEILEALGLNQPAMGQQETSGQSGYAIRQRAQTASDDLEKVRKRHNDMHACLIRYELFQFRRYADTPWKIEVLGENQRAELREFDKTAILPGTNVWCVNDGAIPRDPQQRMLWLTQFMATGVMQLPKPEKEEMFQLMRLQDFKAFEERQQGDRQRARRQILRIENDQDPGAVSDMDDHLIQMNVLREYGLSQQFETRVEQELMLSAKQLQAAPPPMAPAAPGMPGMPGAAPPAQPTSRTFTRLTTLYKAHKDALIAQQSAQAPPPSQPMGGGGGGSEGPRRSASPSSQAA